MTISLVNSSAMSVLDPSSDEPTMVPALPYSAWPDASVDLERAAVDALEEVGAVEGRDRDFGEVEVAAVGVVADDAAVGADADGLQLAGRETVLLDLVDLDVAVGIGELGDAAGAEIDDGTAERNAVDDRIGERDRRYRRGHLARGREGEVGVDVLPGDLGAGRVGINLVEQVPGIGMAGAERGAVGLGPAELQVHRRTRHVVGRDRTARHQLVEKRRGVVADDLAGTDAAAAAARRRHGAGEAERGERRGVRTRRPRDRR